MADSEPAALQAWEGEDPNKRPGLLQFLNKTIYRCVTARQAIRPMWREVSAIVHPERVQCEDCVGVGGILGTKATTKPILSDTYRSAITSEVMDCVYNLYAATANRATSWLSVELSSLDSGSLMRDEELGDLCDKWLNNDIRDNILKVANDQASNFYQSTFGLVYNAFHYGTGVRYIRHTADANKKRSIRFEALENGTELLEETDGEITAAGVQRTMTHTEAARRYGKEKIARELGYRNFEDLLINGDNRTSTFTHIVIERNELCTNNISKGSKYCGFLLWNKRIILEDDNLNLMPYTRFKLEEEPGSEWGSTVLFSLLGTIKRAESMMNELMTCVHYMAGPIVLTTDELSIDQDNIVPKAIIEQGISITTGKPSMQVVTWPMDIKIAIEGLNITRQEISSRLLFGSLTHPEGTPGMTVTEVQRAIVTHNTRKYGVIENWVNGDMVPTCAHIIEYLLDKKGGGVGVPQAIAQQLPRNVARKGMANYLQAKYTGLIEKERKLDEAKEMQNSIVSTMQLAQLVGQTEIAADRYDIEKILTEELRLQTRIADVTRTKDEAKKMRSDRNQQIQQAQQQQQDAELKKEVIKSTLAAQKGNKQVAA